MGAFGDRFAKVAEVYGAAVTKLEVEWGQAAEPAAVREAAAGDPGPQGRAPDPQRDLDGRHQRHRRRWRRRSARSRPDALILVDAISALGAVPFAMDDWGLDLVVTGSQKAWMSAPGHGDGRRRAARVGGRRDGADAPLLPRPQAPPRHGGQRRDARGRRPSRSCTRSTRACG